MRHHVTAGVVAFLVASVTASAASPLPASPSGYHATGEEAQNQRISDLDARLSDAEKVVAWTRLCVAHKAVKLPTGEYALVLSKTCGG
jgi:hypothetical protein